MPSPLRPAAAGSLHISLPRFEDLSRIDVTLLAEVDRWTEALGVSEAELRLAVAEVGVSAQDVRDYLGK